MGQKIRAEFEAAQADDEMFGDDAPDHFLDPIVSVLLADPVKLPTSGTIVERAVIIRHLLNDETDPFNRAKLTGAVVEEYNERPEVKEEMQALKKEIEEWKKSKKAG